MVAIVCLFRKQYLPARLASSLAVTAILVGLGGRPVPLHPGPDLTIEEAATGRPTLQAMLLALAVGAVILVPALVYLYRLFQTSPPEGSGEDAGVVGVTSAGPYG